LFAGEKEASADTGLAETNAERGLFIISAMYTFENTDPEE